MLLLLALLLTVGAGLLMERLNDRALVRVAADDASVAALKTAREALIAWALTNPGAPGRLPFPDRASDTNFDGLSDCVNTGTLVTAQHLFGRYPWRGDDAPGSGCLASIPTWPLVGELRDAGGDDLWYAVSENLVFNGNGGPLNVGLLDDPSAAGWLTVRDASGNVISNRVAAVILAPGPSTECQDRDLPITDSGYAAQFLDRITVGGTTYSNADTDESFVVAPFTALEEGESCSGSPPPSFFNDRVVFITADELLDAVQKRVASEVAAALQRYRAAHGRYPWLSTFEPPDSASFDTDVGTTSGQLAFTDVANSPLETFIHGSALDLSWTADNASLTLAIRITSSDPSQPVVNSTDPKTLQDESPHFFLEEDPGDLMAKTAEAAAEVGSVSFGYPAATCTWLGANEIVRCSGLPILNENPQYSLEVCRHVPPPLEPQCSVPPRPVSRTIEVVELSFEGDSADASGTDAANRRVRRVVEDRGGVTLPVLNPGTVPPVYAPDTVIIVTDTVSWGAVPGFFPDDGTIEMIWTLTITGGDNATLTADSIFTELQSPGPDPEDLPPWFAEQRWAPYLQVSYPAALAPGAAAGDCTAGSDCVTVTVSGGAATVNDARAVVMASGALLGTQSRAGASPGDAGFEDLNQDADPLTAERKPQTAAFNDRVVLVECGPSSACR